MVQLTRAEPAITPKKMPTNWPNLYFQLILINIDWLQLYQNNNHKLADKNQTDCTIFGVLSSWINNERLISQYQQKQYYNFAQVMDLKAHQQALQNIRNKYSQQSYVAIERTSFVQPVSHDSNKSNELFKTPIKAIKKVQAQAIKTTQEEKKQSRNQQNITLGTLEAQTKHSLQSMFSKKLVQIKQRQRGLDQIMTEREKQLTERVERNRQLLSKSKEVRERESKNNSFDKNGTKTVKQSSGELNQLKLILKDKNYVINDKASKPKKISGIGINITGDQNLYSTIKKNFTEKIRQSISYNFSHAKKRDQKKPEQASKTDKMPKYICNHIQGTILTRNKKQSSLIKTPIPPPKQSSPSKISSIFQNTQKIEDRIHALLSR